MLTFSLKLSAATLVWPCKLILFSVHNYLTGRDYSYSIDDLFDLIMLVVIAVWYYTYIVWSGTPLPPGESRDFIQTNDDLYFFHVITWDSPDDNDVP